jgi:hypothetical protein
MPPDRLLTDQRGLVSTAQLRAAGLSPAAIRRRLDGQWRLVLPRVVQTTFGALDQNQRLIAAALYAGRGAVISSLAAAAWHGVGAADGQPLVHVEVPSPRDPRGAGFVVVRRTRRPDGHAWSRGPVMISSAARAVATAAADAATADRGRAIVIEAVQRRVTTLEALRQEIELGPRAGSAVARAALREAETGAWSVPEADLLRLLAGSTVLPRPWANPDLRTADGIRLPRPDGWFDDVALAVQVPSRRYHAGELDWEATVMSDGVFAEYGVVTVAVTPVAIRRTPTASGGGSSAATWPRRAGPGPRWSHAGPAWRDDPPGDPQPAPFGAACRGSSGGSSSGPLCPGPRSVNVVLCRTGPAGPTVTVVSETFFTPTGGDPVQGAFEGTVACTGPWSSDAMHGGPPSALLVRACEQVTRDAGHPQADDLVALRAVVDFLSPVPVGPVGVQARVLRAGRRISLAEARMTVAGKEVLQVRTWLMRTTSDDAPAPARAAAAAAADPIGRPPEVHHPGPQACPPAMTDWAFPYARAIEWRHVSGDPGGPGDAAAWARQRIPLLPGEQPSGLQRAVLVADSGNGISAALDWDRWSFVNIDLAVHLSRSLVGEWVLLDARTRYEPGGTGLATSVLHDVDGVVGIGAQTLLISRQAGSR